MSFQLWTKDAHSQKDRKLTAKDWKIWCVVEETECGGKTIYQSTANEDTGFGGGVFMEDLVEFRLCLFVLCSFVIWCFHTRAGGSFDHTTGND